MVVASVCGASRRALFSASRPAADGRSPPAKAAKVPSARWTKESLDSISSTFEETAVLVAGHDRRRKRIELVAETSLHAVVGFAMRNVHDTAC